MEKASATISLLRFCDWLLRVRVGNCLAGIAACVERMLNHRVDDVFSLSNLSIVGIRISHSNQSVGRVCSGARETESVL